MLVSSSISSLRKQLAAGEITPKDIILDVVKAIEARNAQRKTGYFSAYRLADLYADLGDKEQAFRWLKTAYRERDSLPLLGLKTDFLLDSIRSDPRFVELVRKIGLPQ